MSCGQLQGISYGYAIHKREMTEENRRTLGIIHNNFTNIMKNNNLHEINS